VGGLAALALALACFLVPSTAQAAGETGCGYARPGSGRYASTICWLDLSGYNETQSRSAAGQPMTVTLPGGYTIRFVARTTDVPGTVTPSRLRASGLPTWGDAQLGNSNYPQSYAGIPGRPAWLIVDTVGSGVTVGAELTLSDIVVTDAQGQPVTGYSFVFGEAEASSANERTVWSADRPVTLLETLNPSAPRGCTGSVLTGLGSDSVTCPGRGTDGVGEWSSVLLQTSSPTSVSQTITTTSNNASAFGIMVAKIALNKQVVGRVRPTDSFDVGVTSPEGSTVGAATTGPADTATTGELTVLPRTTGQAYSLSDAVTPGSGTTLSDYSQSWSCTNNGAADPSLPSGAGTVKGVSPQPGDSIACTVTNTQLPDDLSIVKTATSSPALPGHDITYDLVVRNSGPSSATNVHVKDPLPPSLAFVSASAGCAASGQNVDCAVPALASGDSRTFTVTARVADNAEGEIDNVGEVSGDTPDSNPSNNRDPERVPVEPLADLSIVKRATSDRLVPGKTLTYKLVVTNHGPSTARDVVVSDPLPRGLTFVSASSGCTFRGGTVTCATDSLASGATLTFEVVTRVASSVGDSVTNTATVRSSTRDPDPSNNRDDERVPPGPEADLAITKIPSVDTVTVGDQLFYTLLVRNDGPSDARDVVVTDNAGPGLTLLSGAPSQGSCSVAGTVTCRLGTLPAGGTAQVLVSARADQAGELDNSATVRSTTDDPNPGNNRDTRRVTGGPPPSIPPADLAIVKTSNRRTVLGRGAITYTLRVTNNGPGVSDGVQVIDTPSLPVKVLSVRASVGSCVKRVPIRCDLGTMAVGAKATVTVVARPMASGTLRNSASVTGHAPDPRPGNNIDSTTTKVRGLLKVTKVASAARVRAGGTVRYRIIVTNASAFALRSVHVCDDLPAGLVFRSAKPHAKLSHGRYCWTIPQLGAGKHKAFTVKARVLRGAGGRKVNVATATAPNARGARSRSAIASAPVVVIAGTTRSGGVTG
jgi:uncharacterized repeat protein (TIGR01451 family)